MYFLQENWQDVSGRRASRSTFMTLLSNIESILVKATHTGDTLEATLKDVRLGIAEPRSVSSTVRALAVEQCSCPVGYTGLSCEVT